MIQPSLPTNSVQEEDRFLFGNINFALTHDATCFTQDDDDDDDDDYVGKRKKRKKNPQPHQKDLQSHLKKAQQRLTNLLKLSEKDSSKMVQVQEAYAWEKALKQVKGEKVKDNVQLLKRSLKRKTKLKQKRQQVWKQKVQQLNKEQKEKQVKRQRNLLERKNQGQLKKNKKVSSKPRKQTKTQKTKKPKSKSKSRSK